MKKIVLLALVLLGSASFAAAQVGAPTTDVLGAHLNYGRGCAACHAPHSGAYGNGAAKTADPNAGGFALWGQDVASLYGKTIQFAGQTTTATTSSSGVVTPATQEVLPTSLSATTPDVAGLLTCLSCHDGNYAEGAMMKNAVYEALPGTYGTYNTVPTLLGNDGSTVGNYVNDHPVGLSAVIGCTGQYNWDCVINSAGQMQMTGTHSLQFVNNYGFFVSPSAYNNQPVVMCTTCHNQHVMNVVKTSTYACTTNATTGVISCSGNTGLTAGQFYKTMFFLRGPYNPASGTSGANQTAQFCRQCHGGESNEMNGGTAGTTF